MDDSVTPPIAVPEPGSDPSSDVDAVGPRIRAIRTAERLSLRKLAERSGLSVGFLSQVERGLSSLALSSLRSVAAALERPMTDFFGPTDADAALADDALVFTLTRAADPSRRVVSGGRYYELLSSRSPGLVLEPMLIYVEPGGTKEPGIGHEGEEFVYVLSGELVYEIAGTEYRLWAGDSLHLRSNTPHRVYNDGVEKTVVVSVVTPRHG
ncbi:XRE family transcriptional regulator [Glaciihabitans tibetensis]|uniref:XRE family transcriptional regulator n=1 Tax=Glaciihabitans tibetensis TaxID=1266600 RepID=A0A2T0V6T7_9MICO|nr:cupin domain-containing protein [Glaciihabitans tibetensis]PRY65890.1 XRE family transcriptional regulator [Glaciihabitans tibetensis]